MNLWRGGAWSCAFQPTCTCRTSIWSHGPATGPRGYRHRSRSAEGAGSDVLIDGARGGIEPPTP
jgi:hypothetical protein